MNNQEEWRLIPEYNGLYSASSHGRIRSEERRVFYGDHRISRMNPARIKKQSLHSSGKYYRVTLTNEQGIVDQLTVHRLVAWAFMGRQDESIEVRHINGNGLDNRPENLCYGTKSDNMRDSIGHRTFSMSDWHPCAKLTKQQVQYIRSSDKYYKDIAAEFGIHPFTVHKIRRKAVRNHD